MTIANAEIRYRVRPLPEAKQIHVTVTIPVKGHETLIQIPRWMPGYYVLQDSGKNLKDMSVQGDTSSPIPFEIVNDHTWKIQSKGLKAVTVSYHAPLEYENGTGHYSGTPSYIYAVGRTQEKCTLQLDVPKDWKIAVGLDGEGQNYRADTYDILADNSVTLGSFIEAKYISAGKPHTIALRGAGASKVDLAQLQKECEFVSSVETDFMGGAPFNKYVWHFTAHSGSGASFGIEHLSSSNISIGPVITHETAGLLAHEFFHLWNVKRIRSKVLGPFDYTKLPKTGALWWLEGVTEYYSQSILWRYGWTDDEDYYQDMASNIGRQGTNPERLKVSPYESSLRVDETNNGRGNSDGFGLSYYDEGYVVGLCLDLELLAKTNGKRTLDDVELALWKMCRNSQPGFEEGEIRKQLIRFGGDSFGPFYDRIVMSPGDLPVANALANIGMEMVTHTQERSDRGFRTQINSKTNEVEVRSTQSQATASALPRGTIIRSVNGNSIGGETSQAVALSLEKALGELRAGSELQLRVELPGSQQESDATVKVLLVKSVIHEIRSIANPTPNQLRLRAIWSQKRRVR